ncbi:hypothetical protein D3C80_596400 [compost metagenome]
MHGLTDANRALVRRFLACDHLEQRRLAGAVRADNADDTARRQLQRQVVDQSAAVKALLDAFQLDDHVAETLGDRNDDLRIGRPNVFSRIDQLFVRLDTGLRLGLTSLRAGCDPFLFARQRLLATSLFASFLLHALGLGGQVGGIVAFVRNATAAVEFENPAGDIVEEVAVVGDHHHGARIIAQVLFKPCDRFGVEMVGRFVEQQQVRLRQQKAAERDTAAFTTRQVVDGGVLRRAAQRFHRHLDLLFEVPEVLAVDDVLELGTLVRRLVRIVHHQFVVAVQHGLLVGHAFHDVFERGLVRIELRLLLQVTDGRTFGEPGFTGIFLVLTGNDAQNRRLTGTVRAENTDLGVGIEGQVDVLKDLLGAIGLVQSRHVIDELTCHR